MTASTPSRPGVVAWLGLGGLMPRVMLALALPGWHLPLRLQLTAVACLCLSTLYFFGPLPISQGVTV